MFAYLGGAFLGWSLGANDSANVFGTAVSSRMVKFRTAVIIVAVFVVAGAWFQGAGGIETLRKIGPQTKETAALISLAAALTVTLMTGLKIPVSVSQAVVGAIVGIGLMRGEDISLPVLKKIVLCWIGTPIGGMVFCIFFYYTLRFFIARHRPTIFTLDPLLRIGLILCGCYGAYALGANNVANVSAVFVGKGMLASQPAALFGGLCIAFGAVTYSKNVMMTVGKGIIKLDAFSAFICVLANAVTIHIFAIIGVPVSTSQAIVGAVVGISIIKGLQVINIKTLRKVSLGWLATPFVAAAIAVAMYLMAHLKFHL